jgi:thiol-disulfide isomerase/thioredoxin
MKKNNNVFAILGLVFSCTISSVLGIIFSIIGLNVAKKNKGYLKSLAIGGLIVGILRFISIVFILFISYFFILRETDTDYKCSLAYDCVTGLFGNYECKYNGDTMKTTITCSKEQLDKLNYKENKYSNRVIGNKNKKQKVNIVVFYGNGCPHCRHLLEYLDDLGQTSYGSMFTVTKYDVWGSSENAKLLFKVQDHFGLDHDTSVPFFVIGNNYYIGFGDPSSMSYEEDNKYKNEIKDAYENGYDDIEQYMYK